MQLLVGCLIVALFIMLGAQHLMLPGPQPDELLQAVPAARLITTEKGRYASAQTPSIEMVGRQWPIVAMPYLGALKSYALVLPFALFGVNVGVLRLATLAMGGAAVLLTFLFTRRLFDFRTAVLASLLLATDPAFILMSRTDWGPVALGAALRCASGLAILHWLKHRTFPAGALVGLCLGLATYEKAHALALVAALLGVGGLALIRIRRGPTVLEIAGPGSGFILGSAPLWLWNMQAGWPILSSAGMTLPEQGGGGNLGGGLAQLPERAGAFLTLIHGGLLDGYIFGARLEPWIGGLSSTLVGLVLVPFALLLIARGWAPARPSSWGPTRTLALITALTLCVILASPIPVSVHHLIIVAPMLQILIARIVVSAYDAVGRPSGLAGSTRAISAVSVAVILAANVAVYGRYTDLMRSGAAGPAWHPAIYSLANLVDRNYRESVIEGMDWGIDIQLLFLTEGRAKVNPLWAVMGARNENLEEKLRQSRYLYITRPPGQEIDPVAAKRFQDHLDATGRSPCERRTIVDEFGRAGYEALMFRGCRS